ncbi:actin cytoskeleton-regulatory complex protein PAN1 [Drosophila guanche]|uniref:Uncharacterized protein n=1 Tax=Drosophila guanche TaxID=7266 RepID=A0A3B0J796_DROGU|nr:actin cytoskeleton-regulatory complex protein PAN1 [Drosophila guanche]SPP78104.1 Hypothetical predicted protein [Drosophila guanche]
MSHQQFHHYHRQHQQMQQVQSDSQLERTLESERNQQTQRSANSNTERVSGLGPMDFRNLCQRLDVNGLRAKLPSLPSLPPLKLPKSLPKLRGRKIFRSSRRNNNSNNKDAAGSAATAKAVDGGGRCSLTLPQQSQQFINRTPQRISTISSLMYEEEQEMGMGMGMGMGMARGQPSTYRSAGSLDDDYYAPESGHGERHSRPISPVKIPSPPAPAPAPAPEAGSGGGQGQPTLTQRLQRGYKSLSELRLKHLFAKQTTLRRDNIEVDRYVEQYEAELRSEQRAQARRDREIADNYDIRFKTLARSRQNTPDSDKQPPKPRSVAEQSGDESGMEETPPPLPTRSRKKPGIAATRFAKVRQPPLQMDEGEEEEEEQKHVEEKEPPPRRSSCKQLLQKLPSFPSSLPSLQRRSKGNENGEETPTPKSVIRQNIKRLRKSIKRPAKLKQKQPQKPADDSDEDQGQEQEQGQQQQQQQQEGKKDPPVAKSTGNLRARLSRFASTEQLQERWRKSFKTAAQDSEESPNQAGAGAAAGAATGMAIGVHLERTLTKLNEKMHQLKFFQRQGAAAAAAAASSSSCSAEAQPKPNTVGHEPVYIDDDEELAATYHHSDSDEDEDEDEEERGSQDSGQDVCAEEAFGQQEEEEDEQEADSEEETQMEHPLSRASSAHAARQMATLAELQAATASAALPEESCPRGGRSFTAWSSESLEEIPDEDYPRVLIHQQHTDDSCESTLIIAVSTKPSSPAPPTPAQWLPNAEIISSFKEQQQQQQQQQQQRPKEAESWPGPRSLYKPKSIDIFEGASGAAFADFDEALRNAPILRISAGSSCDTSGDEEADDSSSRVTRIRMQTDPPPQIGNSRESLMAQELEEEEKEEEEEQEEEEDSPKEDSDECALERPPSASPPPPPLPQRRPPQRKIAPPTQAAPIYDAVPPPLPTSKPPPLSMPPAAAAAAAAAAATPPPAAAVLPQRSSASMSRPAKPLVKTSSLRLTYNEQVHPGDIGKVNKLISRFEGGRRPRLCPRRLHSEEYELHATSSSFSGEEEEEEEQDNADAEEDEAASPITPTNRPAVVIPEIVTTQPSINNNNNNSNGRRKAESLSLSLDQSLDRQNSNCSRSEYGSPLSYSYSSQRRSSTPTGAPLAPPSSTQLSTPHQQMLQQQQQQQQQQRQQARRSRRSMTRDDENFYSFDSDEENSYYSISPSGSSRYVVEI